MVGNRRLFLLIVTCCGLPFSQASAQVNVEVGPLVAYYRPIGEFGENSLHSTRLPKAPSDLSGLAYGAEARIWSGHRFGVQVQASVASSTVGAVATPGGLKPPATARVLVVSAQGLYAISPVESPVSIWVSGGPGLVHHGGEVYDGLSSTTDLAGVLGVGGRASLPGGLSASAGLAGLFYSFDIPWDQTVEAGPLQHGFRKDLLLHLGISWQGPERR